MLCCLLNSCNFIAMALSNGPEMQIHGENTGNHYDTYLFVYFPIDGISLQTRKDNF